MRVAIVFGSIILIMVLLISIPSFIYLKIYQDRINRRMSRIDEKDRKPMPEPRRFCIIWSVAVVILPILFIAVINSVSDSRTVDGISCGFEVFEGDDMDNGYIANFSMEENTGYIKAEKEEKNFRITAFFSKEAYDGIHPNFIVYVCCTDNEEYAAEDIHGEFFCDYSENILGGRSYTGGDGEKIVCFAGYMQESPEYNEYFRGHVYYMDEENMKEEKKSDYEEVKFINTGCIFTLDFNNNSVDIQMAK